MTTKKKVKYVWLCVEMIRKVGKIKENFRKNLNRGLTDKLLYVKSSDCNS